MKKVTIRLTASEFKKIKNAVFENGDNEKLISYLLRSDNILENQICKIKAANTLGNLQETLAIIPLINVLSTGKIYSRLAASEALGKIGCAAVDPLILYLGKIKETQDINPPEEAFWDKSYYVHDPAARTLVRVGKCAVPALVEIMKSGNDFEVQQAVDALGRIGDKSIVEILIFEFYKREDNLTRWKIIRAIGELCDRKGAALLQTVLKAQEYVAFIRWEAANGLGKMAETNAIDDLLNALKNENKEICRASVRALGKIGDARAIEPLQQLLAGLSQNFSRKSIQYEVIHALKKLNNV